MKQGFLPVECSRAVVLKESRLIPWVTGKDSRRGSFTFDEELTHESAEARDDTGAAHERVLDFLHTEDVDAFALQAACQSK